MREKGVIRAYIPDRGFGFIRHVGTPDLFFHVSQFRPESFSDEQVVGRGLHVEFEVQQTSKGLAAVDITVLRQVAK